MTPIHKLNYMAPKKSYDTEELVGYRNEELAEMHFVCGVCCSGTLTDATVHHQRLYPASRRLHSNRFQRAHRNFRETVERAPWLGPDDALDAAHRSRSKKYTENFFQDSYWHWHRYDGVFFEAEFYQRHLKITQTLFFFQEITPAVYNFVNSFSHAFLPDIPVTEDALNTRDTINNIGILCAHNEIHKKP